MRAKVIQEEVKFDTRIKDLPVGTVFETVYGDLGLVVRYSQGKLVIWVGCGYKGSSYLEPHACNPSDVGFDEHKCRVVKSIEITT